MTLYLVEHLTSALGCIGPVVQIFGCCNNEAEHDYYEYIPYNNTNVTIVVFRTIESNDQECGRVTVGQNYLFCNIYFIQRWEALLIWDGWHRTSGAMDPEGKYIDSAYEEDQYIS